MATKYFNIILAGLIISGILLGCSVSVRSYIRNTTDAEQNIFIKYIEKPENMILYYYGPVGSTPAFNEIKSLHNTLMPLEMDNGTYKLKIPGRSIVFIEYSPNFRSLVYQSINAHGAELIENDGKYSQAMKMNQDGLGKFVIWFDIE